ncbi:MAG TPA: hypothetical protein VMW50_07550 [Dehalococcoidia bacterium]|nr:hypothetical protein [Dehalococcoidia bacterium]
MSRGGIRHGRPHAPVESCHSLSSWGYFQFAQMWADNDMEDSFEWEFGEQGAVIRFTRDGCKHTQEIALTLVCCRFGGWRAWFICPSCGRRVGKVYLPCSMYYGDRRATRFQCRLCYGLTYEQRRERNGYWTLQHRIERIEARWLGEISDDWISKRKWQHWRTFNKWCDQRDALIRKENQAAFRGLLALGAI